MRMRVKLYIIIPCYNEEAVLLMTAPLFLEELKKLAEGGKISEDSRILYVDDGSKDRTWALIEGLTESDEHFLGIRQSRNRGHQNALLAGLMEAKDKADVTVTIDCDGQDDITAMEAMLDAYEDGCEIVYGVRNDRSSDKWMKRNTARWFYRLMNRMGTEVIYDHADYRLVSSRVLREFANFKEVNLFLRGMFPLIGFKSTCVMYERKERMAGRTHYPLFRMISLALSGITSLSIKPIRIVTAIGITVSFFGFCGVIWAMICAILGKTVTGWASIICIVCFMGGIQLICLGIIGEYVGRTYMEVKERPRYIISDRVGSDYGRTQEIHED